MNNVIGNRRAGKQVFYELNGRVDTGEASLQIDVQRFDVRIVHKDAHRTAPARVRSAHRPTSRWPVSWMNTSSNVGLPTAIDSTNPGADSITRGNELVAARDAPGARTSSTRSGVTPNCSVRRAARASGVAAVDGNHVPADAVLQGRRRVARQQLALGQHGQPVAPVGLVHEGGS